jgi:hypothetical protein
MPDEYDISSEYAVSDGISYVARLLYDDDFCSLVNNLEDVLMSTEDGSRMLQALVHSDAANFENVN